MIATARRVRCSLSWPWLWSFQQVPRVVCGRVERRDILCGKNFFKRSASAESSFKN